MNSRREFLQKVAAASVVIPFLPEAVEATTEKYEGPILRVAILGLGSYGTRVADAMQSCKKAQLVGAVSGTPSKLTAWQSKYNIPAKNCYNYQNFDDIKNNP